MIHDRSELLEVEIIDWHASESRLLPVEETIHFDREDFPTRCLPSPFSGFFPSMPFTYFSNSPRFPVLLIPEYNYKT